ncbi:hypothetical protein Cni_G04333 [Canna indica]|uniref:SHSP domain-containing protein n=1 Tax=Canna indica TaxID=4628 RepID=A0AAQ3JTE2_9LILI|nr:hypothetical protein Cni_G04333 [Canna indica]
MRVHPIPMRRGIALRYDVSAALSPAEAVATAALRRSKLRRLPHVFSKVLELPLAADADVDVHEGPQGFRFVAAADGLDASGIRAHALRIHPGVTKVVVRDGTAAWDELDLDRWRFRLPSSTNPALATAEYRNGELVVTVPKGADSEQFNVESGGDTDEEDCEEKEKVEIRGHDNIGLLLLVQ